LPPSTTTTASAATRSPRTSPTEAITSRPSSARANSRRAAGRGPGSGAVLSRGHTVITRGPIDS
jgi:hypothetical protein